MIWLFIIVVLVALATLAMRRAPLWQWAVTALVLGFVSRIGIFNDGRFAADLPGLVEAFLPGVILALLCVDEVRRAVVTGPAYGFVKSILPRVSRTE